MISFSQFILPFDLKFGELGPKAPRRLPPASSCGLNDHRDEGYALSLAELPCVLMRALTIFVPCANPPGILSCVGHTLRPECEKVTAKSNAAGGPCCQRIKDLTR